ncbi:MAG: L-aspartate oxidase [Lentisphaerae bacterium]|nr:L-aspartate oxidase [Lentisphaerota bacterium]
MDILNFDYVVIGSGIAGLMSAIHLARHGRVAILTKKDSAESNTNYAQGGIACVVTSNDSLEEHVRDTLAAGDGLCDEAVVRTIISAGPARIAELEGFGLKFSERADLPGAGYDLGREGGHSRRRVLHCGDITGREVERVLLDRVRAEPTVTILEHCMVIDLITTGWLGESGSNRCVGGYFLNTRTGAIAAFCAPFTVLATGGGGKVYLYTTNPDIATGDGVALAWRVGAPIKNLEFIQFHPTCLYHPEAKSFLISEAVRGEGARLVNARGEGFMERYDPRGSLAPRDIVARAIDNEMKVSGERCVYLDIRHKPVEFLKARFPNIYLTCARFGIDMARDLIPVVPAAHYFCGGVAAQVDGSTAVPGLYACGEVACTGVHGANRLASNSLLEALVCAHALSQTIGGLPRSAQRLEVPTWQPGKAVPSDEAIVIEHNWNEVRTCMWDYVGIVRTNKRLERARSRIGNLRREIQQYYFDYLVTSDLLELRNIAAVGELIVRSGLQRQESRGLHYTLDYPQKAATTPAQTTIICDPPGGRGHSPNNG